MKKKDTQIQLEFSQIKDLLVLQFEVEMWLFKIKLINCFHKQHHCQRAKLIN